MIHHVSLGTSEVERARRFYDPVMELLGLRMLECEHNGVHYFGAFVFDPDGNKIEAVTHSAE